MLGRKRKATDKQAPEETEEIPESFKKLSKKQIIKMLLEKTAQVEGLGGVGGASQHDSEERDGETMDIYSIESARSTTSDMVEPPIIQKLLDLVKEEDLALYQWSDIPRQTNYVELLREREADQLDYRPPGMTEKGYITKVVGGLVNYWMGGGQKTLPMILGNRLHFKFLTTALLGLTGTMSPEKVMTINPARLLPALMELIQDRNRDDYNRVAKSLKGVRWDVMQSAMTSAVEFQILVSKNMEVIRYHHFGNESNACKELIKLIDHSQVRHAMLNVPTPKKTIEELMKDLIAIALAAREAIVEAEKWQNTQSLVQNEKDKMRGNNYNNHSYKKSTSAPPISTLPNPTQATEKDRKMMELKRKIIQLAMCNNCGKMGHYAKECRSSAIPREQLEALRTRADQIKTHEERRKVQSELWNLKQAKVQVLGMRMKANLPELLITITSGESNWDMKAMADSGASRSVISSKYLNRILTDPRKKVNPPMTELTDAEGKSMKSYGEVELSVSNIRTLYSEKVIQEGPIPIEVIIADIEADFILGFQDLGELDVLAALHDIFKFYKQHEIDKQEETSIHIDISSCNNLINSDNYQKLLKAHQNVLHSGVVRTLDQLNRLYPLESYKRELVKEFIENCDFCQKARVNLGEADLQIARTSHFSYELGSIWELDVNYFGKDNLDKNNNKEKKYMLVMVEALSRWVEIVPLTDLSEDELYRGILITIGRFGIMDKIIFRSDQGKNFIAATNQRLMRLLKIDHQLGTPYSHQDQSIVENRNREVNKFMRSILKDIEESYGHAEIYAPLVQRVMNSLPIATTGYAPAEIMTPGINLTSNLYAARMPRIATKDMDEYIAIAQEIQDKIIQAISKIQLAADIKRRKGKQSNTSILKPGELVLVRYADNIKPHKWTTPYYGPLKVVNQDREKITIEDLSSLKQYEVHIARLKRYKYLEGLQDPLQAAASDRREQIVTAILSHRGEANDRANMIFETQWKTGAVTLEPYKTVRHLAVLDEYIHSNPHLNALKTTVRRTGKINIIGTATTDKIEELERTLRWDFPQEPLHDEVDARDLEPMPWIMEKPTQTNITNLMKIGGTVSEQETIKSIINEYEDVFSPLDSEHMVAEPMKLRLKDNTDEDAVYMKQGRMNQQQETYLLEFATKLEQLGILIEATPDTEGRTWNSRVNLINETKEGDIKYRLTLDYAPVNKKLTATTSNIPRVEELIQNTSGMKCLGKFDLTKYFYQIPLEKQSQPMTAFTLPNGQRKMWTRCPMGIAKSAGYAQTMTTQIFGDAAYIDDVMVKGKTFSDFLQDLTRKLQLARKNKLKISASKTELNLNNITFLGRICGDDKCRLTEETKTAVRKWREPVTVKELQQLLGLTNYTRNFIPNYAQITKPLYNLITKGPNNKNGRLPWTTETRSNLEQLKSEVINNEGLYVAVEGEELYLNTDASNKGWGAILYQLDNGEQKRIISFLSGSFNPTQQRWPTLEQEAFAIYASVTRWRFHLIGREFTILTDHRNLTFLLREETKKILRWRMALTDYTFKIQHIAGENNSEADILSRLHK